MTDPSIALLAGVAAAWAVFRLIGGVGPWPWRIGDLAAGPPTDGGPSRRASVRDQSSRSRTEASSGIGARSRTNARTRTGRRQDRAVEEDLPAVVDLLHVAITAGHSLRTSIELVGSTANGPVGAALGQVARAVARGAPLVDELARLVERTGPATRPLVTTLSVAVSSGAPLAPTLQRLADAERRRLRRRTEERVRRLPVLLLAPLVGLILPAFVVLTIVPVVLSMGSSGLTPEVAAPVLIPPAFPGPVRTTDRSSP